MRHVVYGFRLIGDTEIRYVGQTKHTGQKRLSFEQTMAKKRWKHDALSQWLFDTLGQVEAFTIWSCPDEESARLKEAETIAFCLAIGHRILNKQHASPARRAEIALQASAA